MSPEDRETITRSVANLWTFNALFIARLLRTMQANGMPHEQIERMLQGLDADTDQILEGPDDQLYAAGLLATVRSMLGEP